MIRSRMALSFLIVFTLSLGACKKKEEQAGPPPPTAAEAPAVTELRVPAPSELPDTVMSYAVASNPAALIQQAEKLLALVGPIPPGTLAAMVTQGMLGIGLKDTAVVDLGAPVAALLLNPKKFDKPLVLAASVKGEEALWKSLEPTWKRRGAADGIQELARESVDTYGIFKGSDGATTPTTVDLLFVKLSGNTALFAMNREVLRLGAPILEERLKAVRTGTGAVAVLRLDHLRKSFQEEVAGARDGFKQAMELGMSENGPSTASGIKMVSWFVDWLFASFSQTREIALAVGMAPDGALFHCSLVPENGSTFSKLLAAQKHGEALKLHTYLPPQTFMALALNVQWKPFMEDLKAMGLEVMKTFFSQPPSEKWIAAMNQMYQVLGEEAAVSEDIGKDGFSAIEVFEIGDAGKASEVLGKMLSLTAEELAKVPEGQLGMKFTFSLAKDLGSHDGVPLQGYDIGFDTASMAPGQAEMMKRMYGESLHLVLAVFDRQLAMGLGRNAEQNIKDLIDRVRKKGPGLPASRVFQNAAGGLDQDAGAFVFLSVSGLIGSSLATLAPTADGKPLNLALPPPVSGVFLRFRSTPESVVMSLRLPADHLKEIGEAVKALTQVSAAPPK